MKTNPQKPPEPILHKIYALKQVKKLPITKSRFIDKVISFSHNPDMILKYEAPQRDKDKLYNFLLDKGNFRGAIIEATAMIREMQENHKLGVLETLILGHAYIAAALLVTNLKGGDKIKLEINCQGPVKGIYVESNSKGEVKGYLQNDQIELDKPLDSFDTSPFIGLGILKVTKYLSANSHPFSGDVELKYDSLAKNFAYYFLQSEQIPTAFDLSIKFDKEGKVESAGGLFLQTMPGVEEENLERVTAILNKKMSISTSYSEGMDAINLLFRDFSEFSPQVIGNKNIRFYCDCERNRFYDFLKSLGGQEKKDMKKNGPFPLTVVCHNCATEYTFSKEELHKI